jgi:glutamyl-tRNA reductase
MLRELHVLHCNEATHTLPAALSAANVEGRALVMHTCQRIAVISTDAAVCQSLAAQLGGTGVVESFSGAAAYGFLLRLSSGLESRLAGETEIFGQIKQAWSEFSARDSLLSQQLGGTMQRLFRDVKQVRSRFLSGIGSASYGSLVRRLLDAAAGEAAAPRTVLLIGAGQLAHAVAPWLKGSELWIWNRSAARAQELAVELQRRAPERVIKVLDSGSEAELAAWREAHDVVVCVPADAERDAGRAAAWAVARAHRGRLIHLGVDDAAHLGAWRDTSEVLHLGAVYELLRANNEQRRAQIERARVACDDFARQWAPERTEVAARNRQGRAVDRLVS